MTEQNQTEKDFPPARIYLQSGRDEMGELPDEITWCVDRIDIRDAEYIRGDIHVAAIAERNRLQAMLECPDEPVDHSYMLSDDGKRHYIENARIEAMHPLNIGRHDTYNAAMVLVGERHAKYDLVGLVNALLIERDTARTELTQLPTMQEAEARAMLRGLQEIAGLLDLNDPSPAGCVQGVARLREELAALVDAAIPFANAQFPDEREQLTDADYLAINQAVTAADVVLDGRAEPPAPTLANGIRDMIAGGRLTQSMIPDDWQWLIAAIAGKSTAPQTTPLIDAIKHAFITCESAPPAYRVILQFPTLSEAQSAHGAICKAIDGRLLQSTVSHPEHIADPDKMGQPEASKAESKQWDNNKIQAEIDWRVARAFVRSIYPSAECDISQLYLVRSGEQRLGIGGSHNAAWLDAALNIAKGRVLERWPGAGFGFDSRRPHGMESVIWHDGTELGFGVTEALAWIDAAKRVEGGNG